MTWARVLVATDLSDEGAHAADACLDLPGRPRMVLVHVAGYGGDPTAALEAEARRLAALGAAVEARVVAPGDRTVARAILEAASEAGVDLIAVGARGRGRAVDRLLGSVSAGVLRDALVDVLVVRGDRAGPLLEQPVIATDLSAISIEAAERVAASGSIRRGTLLLVGPGAPPALLPLAERLGLEPIVRSGAVVPAIIAVALEVQATVIAVGRVSGRDAVAGIRLGRVAEGVAMAGPCPVLVACPVGPLTVVVRELLSNEFSLADEVWLDYHQTRGDPAVDRIFGLFSEGILVSLARCRRHPDGYELDAVFTPEPFRQRGYARRVVAALVEALHNEDLFMHAIVGLEDFYGAFGFVEIPEVRLPPTIRARYEWAGGNLENAGVTPMRRPAGWYRAEG